MTTLHLLPPNYKGLATSLIYGSYWFHKKVPFGDRPPTPPPPKKILKKGPEITWSSRLL